MRIRDINRKSILSFTGSDESKWRDWRWQLRHIARDARLLGAYADLSDDEIGRIRKVSDLGIPFGVTPYYASLFTGPDERGGRAIRTQVIFPDSYICSYQGGAREEYINDFMLESDTSPVDLVTRRYPGIVILKPYNSCPQICVYCQRNWEIKGPLEAGSMADNERLDAAIGWIRDHDAITEVLITGARWVMLIRGLTLLEKVSRIDHVERIRIGTRTPVTLPMRLTEGFCDMLASFRSPGRREIAVVTHIQHPYEVTPDFVRAVENMKTRGIPVYNQLVFTYISEI